MKQAIETEEPGIVFKNLTWFFIASTALIFSGFIVSRTHNFIQLGIILWSNILGLYLVYRLNDVIDQDRDLKFNLKKFFSYPLHKVVVGILIFLNLPAALFFLDGRAFILLAIAAVIGVLYSINFHIGLSTFRLKNLFLVKNILIGLIWGMLVLIGSGVSFEPAASCLFIFACIQVFIGGMIRDIPDLERDRQEGVRSFPVVIGVKATIVFMFLMNLASLAVLYIVQWDVYGIIVVGSAVLWRAINLILLRNQPDNKRWSQEFNLFTCVVILVMLLILLGYEYF